MTRPAEGVAPDSLQGLGKDMTAGPEATTDEDWVALARGVLVGLRDTEWPDNPTGTSGVVKVG